jgi:UBX domain-containing protein 6
VNKLKETYREKPVVELEASPVCPGVFFHCPLIGPEVLPKDEMKLKIKQFLYDQLEEEKGLTACLIIHTLAKDSEKVRHSCLRR